MATHGLPVAVLLDSASFLLSAVLIGMMRVSGPRIEQQGDTFIDSSGMWKQLRRDVLTGLQAVAGNRLLLTLFLVGGLGFVGEGIINVVGFPWLALELGGGAAERGWLATAQAVGGITGGLLVRRVIGTLTPSRVMGVSAILFGVMSLLLANITRLPLDEEHLWPMALILKGLSGMPLMLLIVSLDTSLVQITQDRFRGRVVAAYGMVTGLALVCGQVVASALGDLIGVVQMLSFQGILYGGAGLVALVWIPRGLGGHWEARRDVGGAMTPIAEDDL